MSIAQLCFGPSSGLQERPEGYYFSAHLLHYNPSANEWQDRGNVADQLRAAGLFGGTAVTVSTSFKAVTRTRLHR